VDVVVLDVHDAVHRRGARLMRSRSSTAPSGTGPRDPRGLAHRHAPRADERVYVNIPKLVVGKMPWGDRPTAADARSKLGTPASQIDALYRSHAPTGAG